MKKAGNRPCFFHNTQHPRPFGERLGEGDKLLIQNDIHNPQDVGDGDVGITIHICIFAVELGGLCPQDVVNGEHDVGNLLSDIELFSDSEIPVKKNVSPVQHVLGEYGLVVAHCLSSLEDQLYVPALLFDRRKRKQLYKDKTHRHDHKERQDHEKYSFNYILEHMSPEKHAGGRRSVRPR